MNVRAWGDVLKDAAGGWMEDRAPRMAGALALYTILSAAPLLVIVLAIGGLIFRHADLQGQIVEQMRTLVGDQGADSLRTMMASASGPGTGWAMAIGIIVLLVGASGVFAELQDALNTIWGVRPKPGRGLWVMIRDRFLSLTMVFGVGFLLLVTLVISTVLAALTRFAGLEGVGGVGEVVNFIVSVVVVTLLFAMMYKWLPDVQISWRDVWVGAAATALLFAVGKLLIGLYLGHAGVGSSYGAAGSLVVFVVWVYYSGQILYFGAEFTKAYANRLGSRIQPSENAEPMTAEARAQQGMAPHPSVPGAARSGAA